MDVETLESRKLFSVTVSQGYPGFYEVDGDASDDTISISVSQTNGTFTLDNTTYTDVQYVAVNSGGGADTVSVLSADGSGMAGAAISGGEGDDNLSLNFDGAIWGGDGNDSIHISDSFYGEVYGEAGNDQMFISGECVDARIEGGDGSDLIDCSGNNYSVLVYGGYGDDTIIGSNFDDQLYGDAGSDSILGGNGNDSIYSYDNGDTIDGGNGGDVAYTSGASPTMSNMEAVY
jgi:Ca2+-binding RTX toxin-like protein